MSSSRDFRNSLALLERARLTVPGVTSSMMKRPEHYAPGRFPVFLASGHGNRVRDVDGQEYLDFICGLGANSLGHCHPRIMSSLGATLSSGLLHSLPTPLELEVAEALLSYLGNAENVRFFKTGADATSAAVRLARALTGRGRVLTVGYNGWHDAFMYDTKGVPPEVAGLSRRFPLFTATEEELLLDFLRAEGESCAALLLSVPYNRKLSADFCQSLRQVTREQGCLLVSDEIVCGFRLSATGAQGYYGFEPDLSTYSKALASGMPLSALVGPKKHMQQLAELQVSTTFGGELLSLAACRASLEVYSEVDLGAKLSELGARVFRELNGFAEERGLPLRILGYEALPLFSFSPHRPTHDQLMEVFQALMAERGILLRRDLNFINLVHTAGDIEELIFKSQESLLQMRAQKLL